MRGRGVTRSGKPFGVGLGLLLMSPSSPLVAVRPAKLTSERRTDADGLSGVGIAVEIERLSGSDAAAADFGPCGGIPAVQGQRARDAPIAPDGLGRQGRIEKAAAVRDDMAKRDTDRELALKGESEVNPPRHLALELDRAERLAERREDRQAPHAPGCKDGVLRHDRRRTGAVQIIYALVIDPSDAALAQRVHEDTLAASICANAQT